MPLSVTGSSSTGSVSSNGTAWNPARLASASVFSANAAVAFPSAASKYLLPSVINTPPGFTTFANVGVTRCTAHAPTTTAWNASARFGFPRNPVSKLPGPTRVTRSDAQVSWNTAPSPPRHSFLPSGEMAVDASPALDVSDASPPTSSATHAAFIKSVSSSASSTSRLLPSLVPFFLENSPQGTPALVSNKRDATFISEISTALCLCCLFFIANAWPGFSASVPNPMYGPFVMSPQNPNVSTTRPTSRASRFFHSLVVPSANPKSVLFAQGNVASLTGNAMPEQRNDAKCFMCTTPAPAASRRMW
mmetsp:Transcript_9667/g.35876  ORF Transcript_9667/g.35876 Transcript_9667/m.35876 type:complete len:305 (+) Transcript_9667:171-1085(+)